MSLYSVNELAKKFSANSKTSVGEARQLIKEAKTSPSSARYDVLQIAKQRGYSDTFTPAARKVIEKFLWSGSPNAQPYSDPRQHWMKDRGFTADDAESLRSASYAPGTPASDAQSFAKQLGLKCDGVSRLRAPDGVWYQVESWSSTAAKPSNNGNFNTGVLGPPYSTSVAFIARADGSKVWWL